VPDEIEITELTDIDAERIDGVGNPASGFPILMMKAVNASGGINEKPDIAGANKVLALLAQLVASEASELAAGSEDELYDISLLLETIRNMRYFRDGEMACDEMTAKAIADVNELITNLPSEGEPNPMADVAATKDAPEGVKTETSAADEPQAGDEFSKDSVAKMIEDAVTKANEASEERVKALEADLAKVLATPIPGQVAIAAPQSARDDVARSQKALEASRFRALAKSVDDRELAKYYDKRAAEAEEAAA
jgi:hypothetical protein